MPILIAPDERVGVERPDQHARFISHAQPPGQRAATLHASVGRAPRANAQRIDLHLQRHPWLRATDGNRATQRVARVVFGGTWLELAAWLARSFGRLQAPARFQGAKANALA